MHRLLIDYFQQPQIQTNILKVHIYGHGMMNLNGATAAVGSLQTIGGNNLLDDKNTSYYDLVNNSFTTSAAFSNALS